MAKSADAKDLKSFFRQRECGFKSHPGHQKMSLIINRMCRTAVGSKLMRLLQYSERQPMEDNCRCLEITFPDNASDFYTDRVVIL